jgi:type IV fimbrial biogenesis protein FimT
MRTRHIQCGVTLVESAVVVAVLAVLAGTAAPGVQALLEARRIDGVATQLATDIQFARGESVARNMPVRLSFHPGSDANCYVVQTGLAAQCSCPASGPALCTGGAKQIKTVILPASQKVTLQSNAASLLFDPLHGTATPAGTLRVLGTEGRAVHHVVNVMGRVRSCSPLGALPGYRTC